MKTKCTDKVLWSRFSLAPLLALLTIQAAHLALASQAPDPPARAFVGARIIDGRGGAPLADGVLIVRRGRIEAIGSSGSVRIPSDAARVDLAGKTVIPGLINAHGHVGAARGLQAGPEVYTRDNVVEQLRLYARYGVTTVASLGGDLKAGFEVRDAQETAELNRSRIFVAGAVVTADTPEEARRKVRELAAQRVDFVKIRVDDNLGSTPKMSPDVYRAVIDEAHRSGLRVAAHLFYLEDAKGLLRAGVDFIAHSVRDRAVDAELIALLKRRDVCVCPTLTREISTFVYEDTPAFFSDPFFLREADPKVLDQLKEPRRQAEYRASASAQRYKKALEVASRNLKVLAEAGISIAFGTDSGPPARFQGYFEHLELELMAKAGLTPTQILASATGVAARCLKLDARLGTLERGKWADFVVVAADPLANIMNARRIESVWIAGNRVP
ncbi:MAG: amidohydrolase family protein [Acidobacteriota bacterium]